MKDLNKVFLIGRAGADAELHVSKTGKTYAKLRLATNRSYMDKEGAWQKQTEWHKVTVWGEKSERCARDVKKGSPVWVEGYLSCFETIDPDGKKQSKTFITAKNVSLLGGVLTSPSKTDL